ncbi:MAG: APC family permease [Candidatus Nanohaloarchaea archaeon]
MPGELGLKEVVAMGVGGIIGGGIFAVLGVAARLSGNAAFLTYFLAGVVALASGYAYYRMTAHVHEEGGSFTFLEHYVENKNIAGMVGWVLVVGYIGTMAMYSYAFGSFAAGFFGFGGGSLVRGAISVGVIALFVGVNFLGARETGGSEDLLVYAKVLILLLFGAAGTWGILTRPEFSFFTGGVFNEGLMAPIIGIGAIFVSFEGFQLLTYEYSEMEGGIDTLKKGILLSIIVSTLIYVLTAAVTTSLVSPQQIIQHKETVLAFAASKIFASQLMKGVAGLLVSAAALFSTASAINATLFGTARFSHKMATENELPGVFSFRNKKGVPTGSLLIIGLLTSAFTFLGSLEEITTFASLAFITVFSVVNYLALKECDRVSTLFITGLGLIGTITSLVLLLWHLYIDKIHVLVFVGMIFAVLFLVEFLYFERGELEKAAEEVEREVEKEVQEVEEEVEELEK